MAKRRKSRRSRPSTALSLFGSPRSNPRRRVVKRARGKERRRGKYVCVDKRRLAQHKSSRVAHGSKRDISSYCYNLTPFSSPKPPYKSRSKTSSEAYAPKGMRENPSHYNPARKRRKRRSNPSNGLHSAALGMRVARLERVEKRHSADLAALSRGQAKILHALKSANGSAPRALGAGRRRKR